MADSKISDLAAVTDLQATDALVLARAGATKKITGASLKSAMGVVLIQEITVGAGGSATVDFTSIPATYRHLELHYLAQTEGGSAENFFTRFNNDSGANYHWGYSEVLSSSTSSTGQTSGLVGVLAATGDASPVAGRIHIPYYAGTTWNKVARCEFSGLYSGALRLGLTDAIWLSTAAISRITLNCASDVKQNSIFSLYGLN